MRSFFVRDEERHLINSHKEQKGRTHHRDSNNANATEKHKCEPAKEVDDSNDVDDWRNTQTYRTCVRSADWTC